MMTHGGQSGDLVKLIFGLSAPLLISVFPVEREPAVRGP